MSARSKKVAAFQYYLLRIKNEHGLNMEDAKALASEQWPKLSIEDRNAIKEAARAMTEENRRNYTENEIRRATMGPEPQAPLTGRAKFLAEIQDLLHSIPRFQLNNHIFIIAEANYVAEIDGNSVRTFIPYEIALAKYSIWDGLVSVCTCITNIANVGSNVKLVDGSQLREAATLVRHACPHPTQIAKEITEFLGDEQIIFIRGTERVPVQQAITKLLSFGESSASLKFYDLTLLLQQLLKEPKAKKHPPYAEMATLIQTRVKAGTRCSFHPEESGARCAAERVGQVVYAIAPTLSDFRAVYKVQGKHYAHPDGQNACIKLEHTCNQSCSES